MLLLGNPTLLSDTTEVMLRNLIFALKTCDMKFVMDYLSLNTWQFYLRQQMDGSVAHVLMKSVGMLSQGILYFAVGALSQMLVLFSHLLPTFPAICSKDYVTSYNIRHVPFSSFRHQRGTFKFGNTCDLLTCNWGVSHTTDTSHHHFEILFEIWSVDNFPTLALSHHWAAHNRDTWQGQRDKVPVLFIKISFFSSAPSERSHNDNANYTIPIIFHIHVKFKWVSSWEEMYLAVPLLKSKPDFSMHSSYTHV